MDTLTELDWPAFKNYLIFDLKMSANRSSIYSLTSRFRLIKEYFLDRPFDRVNFIAFIAAQQDRGISLSAINKYIGLAKNIARYLKITELESFTYYKEKKKDVDCLTWEEMDQLATVRINYQTSKEGLTSEQQNHRMFCYIRLLSLVGCRSSEATKLKWSNIHSNYLIFEDTKNGDDRRVPIKEEFYQELMKLPKLSERVFNLSETSVQANFDLKRRAKRLGIVKPIYNHIFRHSLATLLLKRREPLTYVMKLVGWKSVETVKSYDQHNLEDIELMLERSNKIWNSDQSFDSLNQHALKYLQELYDAAKYSLTFCKNDNSLELVIRKV